MKAAALSIFPQPAVFAAGSGPFYSGTSAAERPGFDIQCVAVMDENQTLIEKIGDQLRAKILSKFQTSAFLATVAVSVLGVQLSTLSDNKETPSLFWISIAMMFGALLLYIAALIKLDELTMPKRFWRMEPSLTVSYYPNVLLRDDELVELRKRMVFYWYTLTLTATGTTGFALLLLLVPRSWVSLQIGPEGTFIAVLAALGVALLYLGVLSRISRRDFSKLELQD